MTIKMETKYGEYTIRWNDFQKAFELFLHDTEVKGGIITLDEAQKWIDKKSKEQYRRIPIFYLFGWGDAEIEEGEATSIANEREAWIVRKKDKKHQKVSISAVILDTPDNRVLLDSYAKIRQKEALLIKERERLLKKMSRLTPAAMKVLDK